MVMPADEARATTPGRARRWLLGLAVLAALVVLYYPVGMLLVHRVDDDPAFTAPAVEAAESQAVATAVALIEREVSVNRWTANDPFFLPGAALDNMPEFQQGIVAALSRFAVELGDQIGRTRGSSAIDADLDRAAGLLKYPGTVWVFDFATSWTPTATSEKQYRAAARALADYNTRLAAGQAVFERRADNLFATLDRIAKDLGSASALIDSEIAARTFFLDFRADNIFYNTKGRLYAYSLLMRDLGRDFANVLAERELAAAWEQMVGSLTAAARLDPLVVVNGAPDGQFMPSHLAAQGFYLLRARTQLGEIRDILLK